MRIRIAIALLLPVFLAGCDQKLGSPRPDTVAVTVSPDPVSADSGTADVQALVTERRTPLQGMQVSFHVQLVASSGANPVFADVLGLTDVNGIATAPLTGLNRTGLGSVTVTAVKKDAALTPFLDSNDQPIQGSAELRVSAGLPVAVSLALNPSQVNPAQNPLDTFSDVSWQVRDAEGNLTADAVQILTDLPGASILGTRIADARTAGNWTVTVAVAGHPDVFDSETLSVLPGNARRIDAFLSNATTDAYLDPLAHAPVIVGYRVTDTAGNDVSLAAAADVTCAIASASGGAINATTGVVSNLVVKGTFPISCTLVDSLSSTISIDTETLTVVDLTPPVVTIVSPAPMTHFTSGQDFTVQVRGQDLVSVSQLTANLNGLLANSVQTGYAPLGSTDFTASLPFTTANADVFNGLMTIYATGLDGSGNARNATPVQIVVDPFFSLGAGISAALVRQDGSFNTVRAIAADPQSLSATPALYIADSGNGGAIWKVVYDRTTLTSTRSAFVVGKSFHGVEWDAAGNNLYASDATKIYVYSRAGLLLSTISVGGAGQLEHLAFGAGGFLYAADSGANGEIWRVDVTTGVSTIFADNGTAVANGGSRLNAPVGLAWDSATGSLFASDPSNDIVYELLPPIGVGTMTSSLQRFMFRNTLLGPNPDAVNGLAYKGAGGSYANQLFVCNQGNERMLNAVRDGSDADLFSDVWTEFLHANGRPPIDMSFHANGSMYVLFDAGNGMAAHVVELSGF